ncbi:hypothetical protein BC939DRAFT_477128 [Gamsiella multidivaricata]|uniref:uncharacterized protein n=1 Tax=Gamsiella multidivaricata TaxID=101098 RepID=UPI00222088F0|nr:uncharacterized protein BC939DRAFT_477128 [Gamsiella multidivaricata]KAG0370970.1 hypothetical protein BGZ54_002117 [Gamsiella multidivaricata]KAI7823588.1 hypothetical protein BC939DRAFT_477128 [Gamsiella multidivaricata]
MAPHSVLELPEIALHIYQFLDVEDCFSSVQVSRLWNKILQPLLPSGKLHWADALPEEERDDILQDLYHDNIRTLECSLKVFKGRAIWYKLERDEQARVWAPMKAALIAGKDSDSGKEF